MLKDTIQEEIELAELLNQARQRQLPFGRIQVLEHSELGILHPGTSSERRPEVPRLADRDHQVVAIVTKDDERGMNVPQVTQRRESSEVLLYGRRQAMQRSLRIVGGESSQQGIKGSALL